MPRVTVYTDAKGAVFRHPMDAAKSDLAAMFMKDGRFNQSMANSAADTVLAKMEKISNAFAVLAIDIAHHAQTADSNFHLPGEPEPKLVGNLEEGKLKD